MHTANLPWNLGVMDWLPASAPESIARALTDTMERPIGVRFFLEDPRARTPHLWAKLPERTEYHVAAEGKSVDIWIMPGSDPGTVAVMQLGTFATSAKEGFRRCGSIGLSTMSVWSFQLQRPVAIRDIRIEDRTHGAVWVVRPQSQTPLQMDAMDVSLANPNAIGSLLALFREGMAAIQPAYRFFCYFKILDAWKNHHGPFKHTDELLKAKGRMRDMSGLVIRDEIFAGKWPREKYADLIGRKFTSLIDAMDDARNFLAHPFRYSSEFVSFDDPATLAHFSDIANIAERMAIEVLVEEIKLIASIDDTGTTQRIARSLSHRSWGPEFFEAQS